MSEETVTTTTPAVAPDPAVESPPPAAMPARESEPDPRSELLRLAEHLRRRHDRRQLIEYLRLRRSIR